MILKKHLSDTQGLADLLNYAHFIEDGIIINKDGAFLMSFKYQGIDINSVSGAELDSLVSTFNRMCTFLSDGWMLHVDECRLPSLDYLPQGHFPDVVSKLIDAERREQYEQLGSHYENLQTITFVWKFPLPIVKTAKHWFVEGIEKQDNEQNLTSLLHEFKETVERCIGLLATHFTFTKLDSADLLSFLNTCITGDILPVALPPDNSFLDVTLARKSFTGGFIPKIGNKHIYVLSLLSYLNNETLPGVLEELGTYPLVYRNSNRFIVLSESTAASELKKYYKNWSNKVKGFVGMAKEIVTGNETTKINKDAATNKEEVDDALTLNSNKSTIFGFWAGEIVLMDEDLNILDEVAKDIARYLEQSGFSCFKESFNAQDAFLGTIPGHGSCNVRRQFISAFTLAHVLPLHSLYTGDKFASPKSLLPPNSPPVLIADTIGNTPFRLHLDVGDVGHQAILGPTGAGKSTYLGLLISQFLRYKDAQIFIFDKDYSHLPLTFALGGTHYNIGKGEELAFCPLQDLSTESKKIRAAQFIQRLVELQKVVVTPQIKEPIYKAINSLASNTYEHSRNLTVLRATVQNEEVREALTYYTIEGQLKILDAISSSLQLGNVQTFEMNWLLRQQEEIYLPILLHIFDEIEENINDANGKKPTLIVLEEAWAYIKHPYFANRLDNWLKTLRKFNARVIFATQSLSDLYDPKSKSLTQTTAAIIEACFTKIYLPNLNIDEEAEDLYLKIGLSKRQIEIIKNAIPKKEYYVVTPQGKRLIDLNFKNNSFASAFIGLSKERTAEFIACQERYPETWLYHWLQQNNLSQWTQIVYNYLSDNNENN